MPTQTSGRIRSAWPCLVILCLAAALASCAQGSGEPRGAQAGSHDSARVPSPFRAVVDRVDDGDTLTAVAGRETFRIRLSGVDAPEFGQRFGIESRNRLRTLVLNRVVDVRPVGVDQYGRLLACPVVDTRDVCETMVADGWAWHYRQYSSSVRLAALEKEAREARRGLWIDPNAEPPWERRAEEREGAAGAPGPGQRGTRPEPAGPFHGNVRSRVYHAAGCPEYDCPSCTAVFATRQEAEAAGYRSHRECAGR